MFNKKYEKALVILNDEINFMRDMFLKTLDLANSITNDEELKKRMLVEAEEYHLKHVALCEFKTRLYKEIGM